MASGGDTKKNLILISVTVLLLVGAVVFGFREQLFASSPADSAEAMAASEEVVNRISGGQAPQVEPDPPGPAVERGSGRRAKPAEPLK